MRGSGGSSRGRGRGRGGGRGSSGYRRSSRPPLGGGAAGDPGHGKGFRQRRSDERQPLAQHGVKRVREAGRGGGRGKRQKRSDASESDSEPTLQLGEQSAYDALLRSLCASAPAAAAPSSGSEESGSEGGAEEEEEAEEAPFGSDAEKGRPNGSGSDGSEADEEESEESKEELNGAVALRRVEASREEAPPGEHDAFSVRVNRVLSAREVATLGAARLGRTKWRPVGAAALPPAPGVRTASWEVADGIDGAAHHAGDDMAAAATPPEERQGPGDYPLPASLLARWSACGAGGGATEAGQPVWASPLQGSLFAWLQSYRDMLFTARDLPPPPPPCQHASRCDGDQLMDACLLHALQHCLKQRSMVLHNSERLRRRAAAAAAATNSAAVAAAAAGGGAPRHAVRARTLLENSGADAPQDQGFTRPKVLLLLPLRSFAKRWLDRALHLLPCAQGGGDAVSKRERLEVEYGPRSDEGGDAPRSTRNKPPDFQRLFAGNRDDHFRLGVKLTRKSVRLFADFAGADLIVASPLGLATRLQAGDASFLSSIELVILDGADVMAMQNWAHVESVFAALNAMPSKADPQVDLMRVRPWYLEGRALHYRQTVVLAAQAAPVLSALLREHCSNAAGRARLRLTHSGCLGAVHARTTQAFTRVASPSTAGAADARFAAFKKHLWPRLRASGGGELLFVPSYFDYVRLRNFLKSVDASFAGNCEYTDPSDVGHARAHFSGRQARIMLYTERAHFFRRHSIRGAARLTCYAPPDNPLFYVELVNALEPPMGDGLAEVLTLFTQWDAPQLERLVGSQRAAKMLRGERPDFLFC